MSNHASEYGRNVWSALRRLRREDSPAPAVPLAWHIADTAATYIAAGGHPLCRPDADAEMALMIQGCDGRPAIWVTASPECFAWECLRRGVHVLGWVGRGAWDVQAPDSVLFTRGSGPPP